MADPTDRRVLEAREPFSITLPDGTPLVIGKGDRFYADDPAVAGREHLFGELTVRTSRARPADSAAAVETATAGPGDRRTRTLPTRGGRRGSQPPPPTAAAPAAGPDTSEV